MSRGKVLVVHEEPYFPRIMRFHLEGAGFETVMSSKREEILSLIASQHPQFLVLSTAGNIKWVIQLMTELFRDPANRSIRVIPVAPSLSNQEVDALLRHGACGYLVEPFCPPKLLGIIQQCSSINTSSAEH